MSLIRSIFAAIIGLTLGLLCTLFAGENPLQVLLIFAKASFLSPYDFGLTLMYSAPLILTGLSVAMAFKNNLFNVGAEGQLIMGALTVACIGILFPNLPSAIAIFLAFAGAVCAGGLWGGIAGYLKARFGAHEVIVTIMLNFVAFSISNYVTMYVFRDMSSQNPQTLPVASSYLLAPFTFFQGANVTWALLIPPFFAIACYILLYFTSFGYEMRAVGENPNAAAAAGIKIPKVRIISLFLAGSLAGLVGIGEVLGHTGSFKLDFSPGYGFTGIAVAFLGRGHPLGIVFSGLLFGILQKGSSDLEIYSTHLNSDFILIFQAFVIFIVCADGLWDKIFPKIKNKAFR